jgi:peptidoglycan/LPS O-acetylase OafA/YrhL
LFPDRWHDGRCARAALVDRRFTPGPVGLHVTSKAILTPSEPSAAHLHPTSCEQGIMGRSGRGFEVLDGLRGAAALAVVLFHFGSQYLGRSFFQHGYLAVDLFFGISGVVIACAYEERLRQGLSLETFVRARIIRLYPTYFLGLIVGLVCLTILNPRDFDSLLLTFDASAAFIPWDVGPNLPLFFVNVVFWSLFLEFVVSLIYGAVAFRLTDSALARVIGLAGVGLVGFALAWGHLGEGFSPETLLGGIVRVVFSFFLGVLIFRFHRRGGLVSLRFSASWALIVGVLGLLALPRGSVVANIAFDLVTVGVVFPLILAIAMQSSAGERARGRYRGWARTAYPLYAVHYPILCLAPMWLSGWALWLVVPLAILFAMLIARYYDEPIRDWLMNRFSGRLRPHPTTG